MRSKGNMYKTIFKLKKQQFFNNLKSTDKIHLKTYLPNYRGEDYMFFPCAEDWEITPFTNNIEVISEVDEKEGIVTVESKKNLLKLSSIHEEGGLSITSVSKTFTDSRNEGVFNFTLPIKIKNIYVCFFIFTDSRGREIEFGQQAHNGSCKLELDFFLNNNHIDLQPIQGFLPIWLPYFSVFPLEDNSGAYSFEKEWEGYVWEHTQLSFTEATDEFTIKYKVNKNRSYNYKINDIQHLEISMWVFDWDDKEYTPLKSSLFIKEK